MGEENQWKLVWIVVVIVDDDDDMKLFQGRRKLKGLWGRGTWAFGLEATASENGRLSFFFFFLLGLKKRK